MPLRSFFEKFEKLWVLVRKFVYESWRDLNSLENLVFYNFETYTFSP